MSLRHAREIAGVLLNKVSYAKTGCKCNNWCIDHATGKTKQMLYHNCSGKMM